jgi:exonuclease SbcC
MQDADKARMEWEKLAADHRAAQEKYQAAKASLPDVIQTGREVTDLREQEKIKEREVGGAQQWVRSLESQRTRRAALEEEARRIKRQVDVHRTLERAFGKDGVPALLIEQALPEIEEQANDLLDRLSVGGMSVRFETQKEYKDKHREDKRETLDILISDGAGTREYEMFSGGEAFRVNFAIRLALSRVLARRAGARLQTLVIDEGFGSQDADGRQRLIEAINLVKPDFEKILVITHLEELKDAFPARIEVEKTPNGSQVKVVT